MIRLQESYRPRREPTIIEARSGSLKKTMKNLEERFGIPACGKGKMQDQILLQVVQIARSSTAEAFAEGC